VDAPRAITILAAVLAILEDAMQKGVTFGLRLAAILLPLTMIPVTELECRAAEPAKKYSEGDRVVQKDRSFTLRTDAAGTGRKVPFDIWCVEKVDGSKLRIRAESHGITGWASVDQLVFLDQAMAYFSDQIRDHPRDAFARVMRAYLWREKKELDKAIAEVNEAIAIDPQDSVAYECRAGVWLHRDEFDKAVADCEAVLRFDPRSSLAYLQRGTASIRKSEYDKAMTDLDQAIRLDRESSAAFLNRSYVWSRKKEYDKSIADSNEAIRINPRDAKAYCNRARAWYEKGDYDKSIADCDIAIRLGAIRLGPEMATVYGNRGWAWMAKMECVGIDRKYGSSPGNQLNVQAEVASQRAQIPYIGEAQAQQEPFPAMTLYPGGRASPLDE
jgi:tetratricopeptide (TPR) repeat protein